MTASQITYILHDICGEDLTNTVLLSKINKIALSKKSKLYPSPRTRFFFDMDNNILEVWNCREYSTDVNNIPSHSNYDIYNGVVYEYIMNGDVIAKDFYSFDKIVLFSVMEDSL